MMNHISSSVLHRSLYIMKCNKVLSNDSMRLANLKKHLENVDPQHINKDKTYFKRQRRELKSMRLDASIDFFRRNNQLLEASYLVAFEIAKQKKPHTIGKTLIKPCILKTAGIVLKKETEKKLDAISLPNNTIQRRIKDLFLDIKSQVVQEIKTAPFGLFAIQLDESTDISSCAHLMVYEDMFVTMHLKSLNFKRKFNGKIFY